MRWDQAGAFDLVIDTGKINSKKAAEWISEAARALKEGDAGIKPTTQRIHVDQVLARAVADGLRLIEA